MADYGICPVCQRSQALRTGGLLVRHHDTKSGPYGSYVVRCKGSSKPPTTETSKETQR